MPSTRSLQSEEGQSVVLCVLEKQGELANLDTDTTIRRSLLHGTGELRDYFLWELLIVVNNCWGILHTARVLHFEQEYAGKCFVLFGIEVNFKNNANIVVRAENPESFIFSVINLAWHMFVVCLCKAAFHCCTNWRTKEISLKLSKFVGDFFGACLTLLSNLLISLSNFLGLLF